MTDKPTLYVCHGDTKGAPLHPCGRIQKAMREKGIDYEKIIGGKGSPLPFRRPMDDREQLRVATGDTKLPAMVLPDGSVLKTSKEIMGWVKQQA